MSRAALGSAVIGLLAAVIGSAAASPAQAATHKMRTISYLGHTFRVPASWPVVNLGSDPTACVRFDRSAVYLGAAPADQHCPGRTFGRTDAIQIQPARPGAGAGAAENGTSHQITSTGSGLTVTATYRSSPRQIAATLASGGLPAPAGNGSATPNHSSSAPPGVKAAAHPPALPTSALAFTGQGFDACSAPSAATMAAWKASSPYGAIGIYIGGVNAGCGQPNLTPGWVAAQAAAGWHFFLIYVGPQAPGSSCTSCSKITSPTSQGIGAAQDAAAQAAALGFGAGAPIIDDMEEYAPSGTSAALGFISAWTSELHTLGYNSGEYSSVSSGIVDLVKAKASGGYTLPDVVSFAQWNGVADTSDPAIPSGDWSGHRLMHQYRGNVSQTYGGVEIDLDCDYLDFGVITATPTPVPAPSPPPVPSPAPQPTTS